MKLLRRHLQRLSGRSKPFRPAPDQEEMYRHLLARDIAKLRDTEGSARIATAGSASLLYLIQRIAVDIRPLNVLDIGAGDASLLWDLLHRHGLVGKVTTLEHDKDRAAAISSRVRQEVLITPLRPVRFGSVQTNSYDWPAAMERGPFDVVTCDGPTGSAHFSRYGVLAVLDANTPQDFVLVLDDVDRAGEQDTVGAIHDRLRHLGRHYSAGIVRAATSQAVFATGRFTPITRL